MTMSIDAALRLPDILREHQAEIANALTRPSLRTWDEREAFALAVQPAAIGGVLVDAIHTHLVNAKIGYLFRKKMAKRDRVVLGTASKASGKVAFYSKLDLLIEVNWEQWLLASPPERCALIDHELCHFGREEDEKGRTVYTLVSHDLEEFGSIVRRWGLWKSDVKAFASVVRAGQSDAFDDDE